ncbi:MAG TPA: hypothetical protein VFG30_15600 [Polyangiales bacterium]|nr:hypothetical protein [Polyangiales bacterium]
MPNVASNPVSGLGSGVHIELPHATGGGGAGVPAALLPLVPPVPPPDEPATGSFSPESSPQLNVAEQSNAATQLSKARRGADWSRVVEWRALIIARLVLGDEPNGSAYGLDCVATVSARRCDATYTRR